MTKQADTYKKHEELLTLCKHERIADILLARTLYHLRLNHNYRQAVGDGLMRWEDYLKQPEIGISKYRADQLVRVYEFFCVYGMYQAEMLVDVPLQALDYIAKRKIEEIDKLAEMVDAARVLSFKDFKDRFLDIVTNEEGTRTYTYLIMQKCIETGNMTKVHDITSEEIRKAFNLE
jgi:hypothetical protein